MNTAFQAMRTLTFAGLVFTLLAGCTTTPTQRTSITPNSSRKITPTAIEQRQQNKKTSETNVSSLSSEDGSLGNRIIAPSSHVGPITRESSEDDLINRLGIENVKATRIPVGEGETVAGTRLFAGTPDEVDIEWKYDRQVPQRITIRSNGANWLTQEGLKIGSSLADVTQINGNPFDITGFEWDYPGRTVDWRGGRLSTTLQLDFSPTREIPLEEVLRGEGPYNSADASMQNMGLVVETISVRWD